MKDNRFYREKTYMPKNKVEFSEMLMKEYGYSQKLAKDVAEIVNGHGAFDKMPKAYADAQEEIRDGWRDDHWITSAYNEYCQEQKERGCGALDFTAWMETLPIDTTLP